MANKTPLYNAHLALGAKMIDFGGWIMPLHYGSQIDEHHQVRRDSGMFDISHMMVVDVEGPQSRDFLRVLLANDVDRLNPGKALYSCMLNEAGGIVDDLITYDRGESGYRLVLNAATRSKDLAWIHGQARGFTVSVPERKELAMISVQGPQAIDRLQAVIGAQVVEEVRVLSSFSYLQAEGLFIARTGYTGEDGVEIMMPDAKAEDLWNSLLVAGVQPCGLGARDTLRLEAGLNLYGADMDESTSPLESGLGWTVSWDSTTRTFIGREALERQREQGVSRVLVGLVLEGRGILRGHQPVIAEGGATGEITSGTFSPTLKRSIALARVPKNIGEHCQVEIRGKSEPARVVRPPFVRHGQPRI